MEIMLRRLWIEVRLPVHVRRSEDNHGENNNFAERSKSQVNKQR